MNHPLRALLLLAALAGFAACTRETGQPAAVSTDYFPATRNHYVIYQTDSTVWDDFQRTVSHRSYRMRYTLTDTFRDLSNRLAYTVLVERWDSAAAAWATHSVDYVLPQAGFLDWVENNLRFRKLVFPATEGTSWNGNSQIAVNQPELQYFQGWTYRYANVGQPFNNGLKTYSNTVTVPQADMATGDDSLSKTDYADRTYSSEVYGQNVGLVYREQEHWVYDRGTNQQFFRRGYAVTMRAVENN